MTDTVRTSWRLSPFRFLAVSAVLMPAFVQIAGATPRHAGLLPSFVARGPSGPGAFGRGGGRGQFGGGFGGGVREDLPLVDMFDKDGDKRLNATERQDALAYAERMGIGRNRGFRGGSPMSVPSAGPHLTPAQVKVFPASVPLYDPLTLRTFFLTFEDANWEHELMLFKTTDVRVPATLQVDGQIYKDVGVQFHGNSSFSSVPEGGKHSMTIEIDFAHPDQRLGGYRTLTLLNSHEDPTYLRPVLFLQAARAFVPAAKANYARVVINGESWGVYPNVEHFNKDFTKEWFDSTGKGDHEARWKVPGSPGARGGLEYLGEDVAPYARIYEIKTADDPASWTALVTLTRVLNTTPPDRLEAALAPILDTDGALKFLALDMAFVNNDGYWTRASDYSLYLDATGRFHVLPYDVNETFGMSGAGGRGGGMRGPGGGGPDLDPLVGLTDSTKPLRSKLLAVPALRARYVADLRDIATSWLDWKQLEPIVTQYQTLIRADMRTDRRKLDSLSGFEAGASTLADFAVHRTAILLDPALR